MGRLVLFALSIGFQSASGDTGISAFVSAAQTQFLHSPSKDLQFYSQVVSGASDKNSIINAASNAFCKGAYYSACARCKDALSKCGSTIQDCGKGEIWEASCGSGGAAVQGGYVSCSASTTYQNIKDDCTFDQTGDPKATAVKTANQSALNTYYLEIGGAVVGILSCGCCIVCAVWLLCCRHREGEVARSFQAASELTISRHEDEGASYTWNLSAEQVTEATKGTKLESPDFQLGKVPSIFRIRFFPKGHKSAHDGNCSAYLWAETNVTLSVNLSVTDTSGVSSKELNEAMKVIQAGKTVGTHNFCEAPADGRVTLTVKVRDFHAGPNDEEWHAAHPGSPHFSLTPNASGQWVTLGEEEHEPVAISMQPLGDSISGRSKDEEPLIRASTTEESAVEEKAAQARAETEEAAAAVMVLDGEADGGEAAAVPVFKGEGTAPGGEDQTAPAGLGDTMQSVSLVAYD